MRILSVGNFLNPSWDGSLPDEEHIASALEQLGHEVTRCQRGEVPVWEDWDFMLIAQWDGYLDDFLEDLSELDIPLVYWAFDYQEWGQEWHERLIEQSDLYLSKRIADSKYPNWQWLSQDFAPQFLDKYQGETSQNTDVLFTGTYLPWAIERNEILKAVDEKFNLVIHSVTPDGWKDIGFKNVFGPAMDDSLPFVIANAKINLSIDHTIEAGYWSDRPAQIMCCGGFVLHRYQPLSSSVFHSFIGYFYDIPSCLQSIEYWLEVDEDRENLASFGYEYAQKHLKVRERVEDLLNIVREKVL